MSNNRLKIISGGQAGADRAALDAALDCNCECGGWCPENRDAEDGPIPPKYPVTPLPRAGYRKRTVQNVIDSDGTVIIGFGQLTDGSLATQEAARKHNRPHLVIDASATGAKEAAETIRAFIEQFDVKLLNVAGPRASKQPAIYEYVYEVTRRVLENG